MAGEVALLFDEAMIRHDPGPGHPECPDRLRAVVRRLREQPVGGTRWQAPRPAERRAIERVHAPGYVDAIDSLCGRAARLDPDTLTCPASVEAAYLAAGAAVDAVQAVVTGSAGAAFALVRPPGHHAERDRAMGFCLFNNVAIGAAHALAESGRRRVLIVDWDVHHGNGTQHAFERRRDVMLFSAHRHPFYPGTGAAGEVGLADGAGFTINVPLPAGCGDAEYRAVFEQLLVPVADAWAPDLVMVSAGFDAHRRDPLGGMAVTEAGFAWMCATVAGLAARHAQGSLVLVLEGGYDLEALAGGVRSCVAVLAGEAAQPALPAAPHRAGPVIDAVRGTHRPFWPMLSGAP